MADMRKSDVIAYFGSQQKAADFIGKTRQMVNQWPDPIPVKVALLLDKQTGGKLKFQKELYQ